MRIPWLSRPQPSVDRRGARDPMPPLPAEPLFVAESRGDELPTPPMSADGDGLDPPAPPRPAPRAPSLEPGSIVHPPADVPRAEVLRRAAPELAVATGQDPAMNAVATEPLPETRGWTLHTSPLTISYPAHIYAVRDIRNLRWERLNGRGMWLLRYDEAVVAEQLPGWIAFGTNGARVAELLEQVAALTAERVRGLPVPSGLPDRRIPVEMLSAAGHPAAKLAHFASSTAMVWTENRGWAVDPSAGGHYYSGCYFVYNLSEPHWLSAMGRAMNAAVAAVIGDDLAERETTRVRREWAELIQ